MYLRLLSENINCVTKQYKMLCQQEETGTEGTFPECRET